jgi:four helix bundle protein
MEKTMAKAPARGFKDLDLWQKSHALVLMVYQSTRRLPKEELFGLTSQMRRAAVSVPANIAEAFKKRGKSDKARILNVAQGSLEELRYYCILCGDLGYLTQETASEEIERVARMLGAYIQAILNSVS